MKYSNIYKGTFIERPNRFIAVCEIDGKKETCHVKNTGRCRELLVKGATVYLEKSSNPNRKTQFDLVAVEKNDILINMDSQIPNFVVAESLNKIFSDIIFVKQEYKYGNSRFDIYIETEIEKIFVEVKGVTLEDNGVVRFPDAPTERGIKHLKELQKAVLDGYRACVIFLVQMQDVKYFEPNYKTHPEFAEELKRANKNGVEIFVYDSIVTPDEIKLNNPIKIKMP
ncbi:MAG: DNA/RNA nuclease SfsA [Clostridia bacterium]|nr:DNA/RNA nuclease SfsA [Clostridia bacterium]